jgi:hypothetical protein
MSSRILFEGTAGNSSSSTSRETLSIEIYPCSPESALLNAENQMPTAKTSRKLNGLWQDYQSKYN